MARMPPCASPFLEIAPTEWFCSNALCFAIPDHKPASRGHLLIITRRHVATWFDCTLPEQNDLMALVNQAKTLLDQQLDPQPDGYTIWISPLCFPVLMKLLCGKVETKGHQTNL